MQDSTPQAHTLSALSSMLLDLDDLLVSCMRCGFCQAMCPVYGATLREADVTRGKLVLLENLAKHMIADPAGVNERLNRCLLCGSCQAGCPSGVRIMDIYLRARAILTGYIGLSPVKRLIFRGMLIRPGLFNALVSLAGAFQGLFLKKADPAVGTFQTPLLRPLVGERHFPALVREPLRTRVPGLDTPAGKSGLKVGFFPGCVCDKIFPQAAEACLTVLAHHGVGVFMPKNQACCGMPALASGVHRTNHALVRHNLDLFRNAAVDYLLTPCATCTAAIKEFWPKLADAYSPDDRAAVLSLAEKAMDPCAFLADVLNVDFSPRSEPLDDGVKTVTYHDSCHMKKSLGVAEQPRRILQSLPGWQYAEMPEADRCCGSGGSFTLLHPDISVDIGTRKRENLVSVNPDVATTGCPACMMQLMDMLSRQGDSVPVRHIMELYAESLNNTPEP